jgi:hypothetical protein
MGLGSFVSKATNKALRVASHVPGARNVGSAAASTVGALTPAIGPLQSYRNAAFSVAHNAVNPNVNVYGTANPTTATPARVASSGSTGGSAPQVLGANTGLYTDGSGGAQADPNLDPTHIAALRGNIQQLLGQFSDAFNSVFGKVDQLAANKANELRQNYDVQKGTLQNTYGDTSQGINNALSARNVLNSSYTAGQQGTALKAFNDSMTGLNQSENQDLANVGQFATQQKAQLQAAKPAVNPNDYTSVSDLLSVKDAVDQALGTLGVTNAGLDTNGQYVSQLNTIAPAQEAGSSVLKSQLDRLATTNAPPEAKLAIANQAISDSGADPNQWLDYFQGLIQKPQTAVAQ